ncbi:MAG: response regulator transcription factor, partial [Oscillochloris sp.]|nr:response regulator transcription factor [Oscillochloris sp.]
LKAIRERIAEHCESESKPASEVGPERLDQLRQAAVRWHAARQRQAGSAPQPMAEALTSRELAVLALAASGASNTEIAGQLVIAISTVKAHINSIFGKLGAHSRTQAIAHARAAGLLD